MEYQEKCIAFLDVLGFRKYVEKSENGTGMPLSDLVELLKSFGSPDDIEEFKKYGPTACPQSTYNQRDLNFKITQISDGVVISSELSPAGLINLVSHCWKAVFKLLKKGILCRGYIIKGLIYHTESQVIGSGYMKAYDNEKKVAIFKNTPNEEKLPLVEVDRDICEYVKNCGDQCVKKMFSRFIEEDGELAALFPFKRLSHEFLIAGNGIKFDPHEEKNSNQNMRGTIKKLINRVNEFSNKTDPDAMRKTNHYLKMLNAQLVICDKTDEMIDKFK